MKCSPPTALARRQVSCVVPGTIGRTSFNNPRRCFHGKVGSVHVEEFSTKDVLLPTLDLSAVSTPVHVYLELPKALPVQQPQDEGLVDGKFRIYSQVRYPACGCRLGLPPQQGCSNARPVGMLCPSCSSTQVISSIMPQQMGLTDACYGGLRLPSSSIARVCAQPQCLSKLPFNPWAKFFIVNSVLRCVRSTSSVHDRFSKLSSNRWFTPSAAQVRLNEVDMFGVVSNTMYPQYMLHARALLMEAMGFSVETLKNDYGIYAATLKTEMTFKTPMRPGDKFYTEVVITEMNRGTSCKVLQGSRSQS